VLGKNGSPEGSAGHEWLSRTPGKVSKSNPSSRTAHSLLQNKQRLIRHFSLSEISMLSRPPGVVDFPAPRPSRNRWGLALLRVRANLPAESGLQPP